MEKIFNIKSRVRRCKTHNVYIEGEKIVKNIFHPSATLCIMDFYSVQSNLRGDKKEIKLLIIN